VRLWKANYMGFEVGLILACLLFGMPAMGLVIGMCLFHFLLSGEDDDQV
jgi:hypothetical protein